MTNRCVAIHTCGGAMIGLGHVRRCLTLAQALNRLGAQVKFILNEDQAAESFVRGNGFDAVTVTSNRDGEQTRRILQEWDAAALVTDSYELEAGYWNALHGRARLLIAIDDLADKHLPVDVVVNGSVSVSSADYSAQSHTKFLLGPSYVLLRKEFSREPVREFHERIDHLLITVGGSDPFGLTPQIMRCVRESMEWVVMDVVLGPFFQNNAAIEQEAARSDAHVNLHFAPEDMRTLMLTADIAITGGGQTTYELAAANTPALAICVASNQRGNLSGLLHAGTLRYVCDADDVSLAAKVSAGLKALASDTVARERMLTRGREVVDGRGAQRAADAIVEELKSRD